MSEVRVYIASSLDGFIAAEDDGLDWLPNPTPDLKLPEGALGFDTFLAQIGAMVMGRRTYDVVRGMSPDWFYGDIPVLVPTHRPLQSDIPTVRGVSGSIDQILDEALRVAGGKDVYIDGGSTIRAALDAGRVDDLIVTIVPVILGRGLSLFAGTAARHRMNIVSHVDYGAGMLQVRMRPDRGSL
jgi:dihydrofolate reductase